MWLDSLVFTYAVIKTANNVLNMKKKLASEKNNMKSAKNN